MYFSNGRDTILRSLKYSFYFVNQIVLTYSLYSFVLIEFSSQNSLLKNFTSSVTLTLCHSNNELFTLSNHFGILVTKNWNARIKTFFFSLIIS